MSVSLIKINGDHVMIVANFESQRNAALMQAATVERVENADENKIAASVLGSIKAIISDVEKARKSTKEPFLEMGRKIDAAAATFRLPLDNATVHIAGLMNDFASAEIERKRTEELKRAEELNRIAREQAEAQAKAAREAAMLEQLRLKEIADKARAEAEKANSEAEKVRLMEQAKAEAERVKAQTDAEMQAAQKRQDELAKQQIEALGVAPIAATAKGQVTKMEWKIESVDKWKVIKARPDLVSEIKLDMIAVKAALDQGPIAGIVANKVPSVTVRASRAIEV